MSLAFDSATGFVDLTNQPNRTFSHSTSGSNRLLLVALWYNNTGGTLSVTYNGVAMTLLGTKNANFQTTALYYLIAPATGSNTVFIGVTGVNSNGWRAVAASYTGAKQSGQPDASTTTGNRSPAITPTQAGCWAVGTAFDDGNTVTPSGTQRASENGSGTTSGGLSFQDSNGLIASGVSYTGLSWSSAGSNPQSIIASIAPDAAPVTSGASFLLNFV